MEDILTPRDIKKTDIDTFFLHSTHFYVLAGYSAIFNIRQLNFFTFNDKNPFKQTDKSVISIKD